MVTEEQIKGNLEGVLVPVVKRSIVGLNMVRDVAISDKRVKVTLASTGLISESQGWIKDKAKEAIETLFDVTVERVNVMNVPAKRTRRARSRRLAVRRSGYKKAIITLAPGDTIDAFEGVR